MPNRILKESICTSQSIDILTPEAEVLFYRIIVNCDDYGRMEASPSILRAKCFPLKIDDISNQMVAEWLLSLVTSQLVTVYEINGKCYLCLPTWDKHQQIRAKKSKYPSPTDFGSHLLESDIMCNQLIAVANAISQARIEAKTLIDNKSCNQLQSDDSKCPRNPIQSNPIQSNPLSLISIKLAEELKNRILDNNPQCKVPTNLESWAGEIDKMIRIDKRTEDGIREIIIFSQSDHFWRQNILSAKKLREKFDQLYIKSRGNNGQNQGRTPRNQPKVYTKPEDL